MNSMSHGSTSQTIKDRPYKDSLKNQIIARRMWKKETFREIGDALGCSMEYAWHVWNDYNGDNQYQKDSFDDLCENHQRVIKLRVDQPEWTQRKIAQIVGIHEATVSRVLKQNQHLIEKLETWRTN